MQSVFASVYPKKRIFISKTFCLNIYNSSCQLKDSLFVFVSKWLRTALKHMWLGKTRDVSFHIPGKTYLFCHTGATRSTCTIVEICCAPFMKIDVTVVRTESIAHSKFVSPNYPLYIRPYYHSFFFIKVLSILASLQLSFISIRA